MLGPVKEAAAAPDCSQSLRHRGEGCGSLQNTPISLHIKSVNRLSDDTHRLVTAIAAVELWVQLNRCCITVYLNIRPACPSSIPQLDDGGKNTEVVRLARALQALRI